MLTKCYATVTNLKNFFLFDTDLARVTLSECVDGSPLCATVSTVAYHLHCGLCEPISLSPCVFLVRGGNDW